MYAARRLAICFCLMMTACRCAVVLSACVRVLQGEYDVQVVARGVDNEELMCVVVHFEM
jgi:hypothetical protein